MAALVRVGTLVVGVTVDTRLVLALALLRCAAYGTVARFIVSGPAVTVTTARGAPARPAHHVTGTPAVLVQTGRHQCGRTGGTLAAQSYVSIALLVGTHVFSVETHTLVALHHFLLTLGTGYIEARDFST